VQNPNVITFVPVSTFIFAMIVLSTQINMYNSVVSPNVGY
jgi:hypothetical protein